MDAERKARKEAYLNKYAALPDEEERRHYQAIMQLILDALKRIAEPDLVEVNPEEIPADNQADVDAAFVEIMDGVDI